MTAHPGVPPDLMDSLRGVAHEACTIAMRYFRPGGTTSAKIWQKSGGSPVTEADIAVDTFLKIRLSGFVPEAGWLSEETVDDARRIGRDLVWVVDPIDGTRAYLSGNPDWSIAIALLAGGSPVLGIVYAPALDTFYEATRGEGARRNGDLIAVAAAASLDAVSVSGPAPFADRLARRAPGIVRAPRVPSLALRIARVADGTIDVGLVSGNARDWDIAAADLVLAEAGGTMTAPDGRPPVYNLADPVHGELVATSCGLHRGLVEAINGR